MPLALDMKTGIDLAVLRLEISLTQYNIRHYYGVSMCKVTKLSSFGSIASVLCTGITTTVSPIKIALLLPYRNCHTYIRHWSKISATIHRGSPRYFLYFPLYYRYLIFNLLYIRQKFWKLETGLNLSTVVMLDEPVVSQNQFSSN